MEIYNQTRTVCEFTMGMDKAGREYLSLVVKGTYDFPDDERGELRPSPTQRPLVMADEFTGEPGYSATLWESDFAFRKPACDVVLQGCAYNPNSRPAERVRVGLRIGGWSKALDVVGDRTWQVAGPAIASTKPRPFVRQPFGYDTAFGGVDRLDPKVEHPPAYRPNPVGTGWAQLRNQSRLSGLALPNTQAVGEAVTSPYGRYRPMALGPYGRGWPGRIEYGGTYDQHWQDHVFPFLPADFDDRYFQTAPPDQQIPYPQPGAEVVLVNLTPRGRAAFRLPDCRLPITVFRRHETALERTVLPDTLLFDTEARQLSLVWRIDTPIRRIITEFTEAWIGPPTEAMLRARREGRRYVRAVSTG